MDLEDFLEPEVAAAAAVVAAISSPRVRNTLRRGAVYGLAGALVVGDGISAFARGMRQGAQQATTSATTATRQIAGQEQPRTQGTGGE